MSLIYHFLVLLFILFTTAPALSQDPYDGITGGITRVRLKRPKITNVDRNVVTWTIDSRASGFVIRWRPNNKGPWTYDSYASSQTSYTIPHVVLDTDYYVRVRANTNSSRYINSAWSQPAIVRIDGPKPLPAPVLTRVSGSTFSWTEVIDAVSYRLRLLDDGRFSYVLRDKSICMVSDYNGIISSSQKDALWHRFYTHAPQRLRRPVEKYKIVKRA